MITTREPYNEPGKVEKEIVQLRFRVNSLMTISSLTNLVGIGFGSILAISMGPKILAAGTFIAFITTIAVKIYANKRKKEISKEVIDLYSRHIISDKEATKLKNQIKLIYSDPPK